MTRRQTPNRGHTLKREHEEAVIAAAKHGDHDAFNQLVLRYQRLAYTVAYRILGNRRSAEDATQEAFLSAYRAMSRFHRGSFKAWLLRIVTNACYDQLRALKRCPIDEPYATPDVERCAWTADPRESPQAYVERKELGQVIQLGLDTLPPAQRFVVVLADIQELEYREIAHVLGIPMGTVKSRLNRGRRRLRDYLVHTETLSARYRRGARSPCATAPRQHRSPVLSPIRS
jgi:RNA polymerase sigma-70 factor (ECF subfamily)